MKVKEFFAKVNEKREAHNASVVHTKKRAIIVRSIIGVVYVALAVCMFITGRSHTVLVDNRGAEDGSYSAIKSMTVTVNHNKPSEFMKGDRDKFTVKGQTLKLKVESFDGRINETYTMHIPLKEDNVIVSVPKLVAGMDNALEHFEMN